jgi:hypothetical protein
VKRYTQAVVGTGPGPSFEIDRDLLSREGAPLVAIDGLEVVLRIVGNHLVELAVHDVAGLLREHEGGKCAEIVEPAPRAGDAEAARAGHQQGRASAPGDAAFRRRRASS